MTSGKTITINTSLVGREEAFRILAIGHATQLPILFVGPPGIAKTNVMLDYASSAFNSTSMSDDVFILEVDEGTRSNQVKGDIDMKELIEHKKFTRNSPITKAKLVLINEVDKASSGLRNAFLGIMNERILFDGSSKVECEHELFCATCNEIPKDEEKSPFWDRFNIKYHMERVPQSLLLEFLLNDTKSTTDIYVPSEEDMNKVKFKQSAIEQFVKVCHASLTDRSILHIKKIAPAVKYIYGVSPERALIKATMLIANKNLADALAKAIEPAELRNIRNMISTISTLKNINDIKQEIEKVIKATESAFKANVVDNDIVQELEEDLNQTLRSHTTYRNAESYVGDFENVETGQ